MNSSYFRCSIQIIPSAVIGPFCLGRSLCFAEGRHSRISDLTKYVPYFFFFINQVSRACYFIFWDLLGVFGSFLTETAQKEWQLGLQYMS